MDGYKFRGYCDQWFNLFHVRCKACNYEFLFGQLKLGNKTGQRVEDYNGKCRDTEHFIWLEFKWSQPYGLSLLLNIRNIPSSEVKLRLGLPI